MARSSEQAEPGELSPNLVGGRRQTAHPHQTAESPFFSKGGDLFQNDSVNHVCSLFEILMRRTGIFFGNSRIDFPWKGTGRRIVSHHNTHDGLEKFEVSIEWIRERMGAGAGPVPWKYRCATLSGVIDGISPSLFEKPRSETPIFSRRATRFLDSTQPASKRPLPSSAPVTYFVTVTSFTDSGVRPLRVAASAIRS